MAGPYRSGPSRGERAEAPVEAGLVGEVIRQFADPLAFYRELVQNAIDADATRIDVMIDADSDGRVVVAVRDDGCGMTQEIVEDQLLVLFRSTKENDPTKIGKFGVGFASVLSPGPQKVTVTTARDGRRLVLTLQPDLTYELFDGGPGEAHGTVVRLDLQMDAEEVAGFFERSEAALLRWCPHARVPLTLTTRVQRPGADDERTVRIDRPLALDDCLVEVAATLDDGQLEVRVGVDRQGRRWGGFYDGGLTLHTTDEIIAGAIVFKVQDGRLGHTISRDDVRRDDAFHRAVGAVVELAREALPSAVGARLTELLAAGDRAGYARLLTLAADLGHLLSWPAPVLAGGDGQVVCRFAVAGPTAWAQRDTTPGPLALDVARSHRVLDLRGDAGADIAKVLTSRGWKLLDPADSFSFLAPVEDAAQLGPRVCALLERVDRAPARVVLARVDGFAAAAAVIRCDADAPTDRPWRQLAAEATRARLPRWRRPPLALSVEHPVVAAALQSAPDVAVTSLAQLVLLEAGRLTDDVAEQLLAIELDDAIASGAEVS